MNGYLLAVLLGLGFLGGSWRANSSRIPLSVTITFLLLVPVALQIHFGATYRDMVGFVVDPFLVALLVQAIAFRGMVLWV